MNPNQTVDPTEILQALRGLSHDMGASHIMLDHSFRRLKSLLNTDRLEPARPEEIHGCLSEMDACMKASKGYLDDLVRLSNSGSLEMEPEPVEMAALVERVLAEQAPLLDEHAVQVQVRGPLPSVWCHPDRLRQVLTNLVRNAVLHGCDPERPRVHIYACDPPDGDDTMAAIRVHDNGPGIDPCRRREIFLPGRRLAKTRGDGSGWGLPAARRIVERFGGNLFLDIQCPTGTAFVLAIPAVTDAAIEAREREAVEEGRSWRLQLDSRHHRTSRHGHTQGQNDECRMANVE